MPGLNLFAYGSDDDDSDEKETLNPVEENNTPLCETSRNHSSS